MTVDGRLAEEPFSFVARADGTVVLRYREAPVLALRGKAAEQFLRRVEAAAGDRAALQALMARATGNVGRGNPGSGGP